LHGKQWDLVEGGGVKLGPYQATHYKSWRRTMPLDPKARAILDADNALNLPSRHTLSPSEARSQKNARPPAPEEPVAGIDDITIPVEDGEIAARVYRPAIKGNLPALVFFHGGGWVVGSIAQTEGTCRSLANRAG
jgi:acetyl esterase